ncbi:MULTISPECIES: hypothetical protein [unclassified Bradyrhizobium]|uniref:hypothetical protein n=1 Tax=unclassified Bradyrhizobium TaxID=2631580 RepID=UPI002916D9F1|nr:MULTISPECIES: hypothetical protein [unclassified Bradyrhizobium]
MSIQDIVFFRDVIMPAEAFEQLPPAPAIEDARLIDVLKTQYGRLYRALIERDGKPAWHAVAWHNLNGHERPIAARIIIRKFQQED